MRREADNNRVKRAIEHLEAAMTNLDSIKWENKTPRENDIIDSVTEDLTYIKKRLGRLCDG